jgi:hypothetical protein
MPRRAANEGRNTGEWVRSFGEQLGNELGRVIADSLQRTLASQIDVGDIARRLGAGGGRRGRRVTGEKALCSEPGCPNPVLAKGLCRSHYYRARYRAQKAGTLAPARGKRGKKRRGRKAGKPAEAAAGESSAG